MEVAEIFGAVDTDESGGISYEEFAEWWNDRQVIGAIAIDGSL